MSKDPRDVGQSRPIKIMNDMFQNIFQMNSNCGEGQEKVLRFYIQNFLTLSNKEVKKLMFDRRI